MEDMRARLVSSKLARRIEGGKKRTWGDENARWVWLIYAVRGRHFVLSERMRNSRV